MLSTNNDVQSVVLQFSSDVSVTHSGFRMTYELETSAVASQTIPCPGPAICSDNGACRDGFCSCLSGFIGEDCSNQVICPRDVSACGGTCDPICSEPQSNVIVVSPYGNDTQGTGERMDSSQAGTAPKAVATLHRAMELATSGRTILLYPGVYGGSMNCDLVVTKDVTIRGLRGPSVTAMDCDHTLSGITITDAHVKLVDFEILNALARDGAAIKLIASSGELEGMWVADSNALENGGCVHASQSDLTLQGTVLRNCSAKNGGGVFADTVSLTVTDSQVVGCRATDGAGMYAQGTTGMTGVGSAIIEQNVATARGGGIFFSGTIDAKLFTVQQNTAKVGGGLAAATGSIGIASFDVRANSAVDDGGGVAILSKAVFASTSSSVQNNEASRNGGGIFVTSNESIAFDSQSIVAHNTAGKYSNCARFLLPKVERIHH